jgi:predicted O-linked N-acetylglucosamine transferase (SPINDLY family)
MTREKRQRQEGRGQSRRAQKGAGVRAALKEAVQHHRAGRLSQAERIYDKILGEQPNHADALNLLGLVAHQTGRHERAVDLIAKAVRIAPNNANYSRNLGAAHKALGELPEAILCFRRALEIDPNHAEVLYYLGAALQERGRADEAIACFRRSLDINPNAAVVHHDLGTALKGQGKLDETIGCFRRALKIDPTSASTYYNLGNAYKHRGRLDEAVASYRRALKIDPNFGQARNNLGTALHEQGKPDEAIACFRRALEINPDHAGAHNNLGILLKEQGKREEAIAHYRRALEINPDYALAYSNLLFCLHYAPGLAVEELFAEHRRWNARFAAPLAGEISPHANIPDPDRPIRVGFVSSNFRRHPVGYMTTPALEARDGAAWELTIYSGTERSDDLTARIRAAAGVWREIGGMTDEAVANLVRDDGIDILVDLAGHADGNRLLVFARKPAPVQVKWVGGQFNTTGMDAMDYFLSDAIETPEGAEKWFTEEVVRLPDGYVCYATPEYAPEVGPLPALTKGYVTFGCFNNLAKVNDGVIALWARLLHRLPGARLILKTRTLGDPEVRDRYTAMFEGHGIERARVDLLPASPHAELMAKYNEIDIALDPFPYSGGLTTCEAMWMGVPVVALAGETFAGRHAASHLHNAGLSDWVVEGPEDYVTVAERWSRDLAALAELRAGLRQRMAASPLCDGPRFARNLEAAFRAMWRRWCEGAPPRPPPRDL